MNFKDCEVVLKSRIVLILSCLILKFETFLISYQKNIKTKIVKIIGLIYQDLKKKN